MDRYQVPLCFHTGKLKRRLAQFLTQLSSFSEGPRQSNIIQTTSDNKNSKRHQKVVWIWERLSVLRRLSEKKVLKRGSEGREGPT